MIRARFLIDECLSVELASLAWRRGYQASHLRDLSLLGRTDAELARVIFEGDWVLRDQERARLPRPGRCQGSTGKYAGVGLHAELICVRGPPEGFTKAEQLKTFAVALDLIEQHGNDPTNLLIEVVWTVDGIGYEVAEFPSATDPDTL